MSWRGLRHHLNTSREAAAGEICAVLFLSGVLFWIGFLEKKPYFTLLSALTAWFLASGFLYFRGENWSLYGFRFPKHGLKVILWVAGGTAGLHILFGIILKPLVTGLTGQAVDLSQFESVKGNITALLIGLGVVWTEAAFVEEMLFRGYFLNRISGLFSRQKAGLWAGIILSSFIFGVGHQYQGISGIILTGSAGLYFALIYVLAGKNLTAPILVHGLYDTSVLLIIYLGI